MEKININEKFSKFSEHWRPKIVAELNGQEFKLAKIKGAKCPQSIWEMDCNAAPKSLAISDCDIADKASDIVSSKPVVQSTLSNIGTPHPSSAFFQNANATFYLWEKEEMNESIKNITNNKSDKKYDAFTGAWM